MSVPVETSRGASLPAHTPGPWKSSLDGAAPFERDPRVWIYASDGVNWPRIATVEAVMRDGDMCALNAANARLIAAAPTMHAYIAVRAEAGDREAIQIMEAVRGNA